ncbi:MAG: hypothetical protein QGH83_07720 [Candidatus Pacebacteria bacterium]|nr:hypothetical protein [Candidatus Paceibacterota bacterium]
MAAETQVLVDNEKKYIAKFFSDASESDVKKVDLSTLSWAKHTITLSGAASPNFKIGEVLTVGAEKYRVTGFTAGASTVEVVGWDNTNKKATAIDASSSNGDAVSGGVSGNNTRTYSSIAEQDFNVLVTKIMWICNGLQVAIEWDGSGSEAYIAELIANGIWSMPAMEWPGIGINASGDSGDVLGDIQFSTTGHASGDSYTVIMELKKQSGYDIPAYEQNNILGYPVDYLLGNFT